MSEQLNSLPDCPDHLTGEAVRAWGEVGNQMLERGILTVSRLLALESYCVTYQRWREAQDKLQDGLATRTRLGQVRVSPYVQIAERCQKDLKALRSEMGLDKPDKQQTSIKFPQAEPDEMTRYLQSKGLNTHG